MEKGIHNGQLLTYKKLSGISIGLPINPSMRVLKDGITRLEI